VSNSHKNMVDIYQRLFPLEIQSWHEAITKFGGEVNDEFVYDVLEIVNPAFRKALSCSIVFDVIDISTKFTKAAKYLVDERIVAFKILGSLPDPLDLNENEQYTLAQIIDLVDKQYKGTLAYLERKWVIDRKKTKIEENS
jgi:hypothetical protein